MISAIDFFHDKAKSIIDRLEKTTVPNVLLKQLELAGEAFTLLRTIIVCTRKQDEINGVEASIRERVRQIVVEGFDLEGDFKNEPGELASAGASYAIAACDKLHPASQGDARYEDSPPLSWPFAATWWKPTTPRRDLVKAVGLMLAELHRLAIEEARDQAVTKMSDGKEAEPEEVCAYCGVTTESPCDRPPVDMCEKALNATYKLPTAVTAMPAYAQCDKAPGGWFCSRAKGHPGACAAGFAQPLTRPAFIDLHDIPKEVIEAANRVETWAKANNHKEWRLGGVCSIDYKGDPT